MSEENKRLFRESIEQVLNKSNLDAVDESIAEEFVEHDPARGTEALSGRHANE